MGDAYAYGHPLTADGLVQLVAEEALRDGELSLADLALVNIFVAELGLNIERVPGILEHVRDKLAGGELGARRRFHRLRLYRRILRYLLASPRADAARPRLAAAARTALRVTRRTHAIVLGEARSGPRNTDNIRILPARPPGPAAGAIPFRPVRPAPTSLPRWTRPVMVPPHAPRAAPVPLTAVVALVAPVASAASAEPATRPRPAPPDAPSASTAVALAAVGTALHGGRSPQLATMPPLSPLQPLPSGEPATRRISVAAGLAVTILAGLLFVLLRAL